MPRKFQLPDLSNATPQMLIDELGKMSAMSNYLKKSIDVHKEALYARVGKKEQQIQGERYSATISPGGSTIVNQEYVKEQHPQDDPANAPYYKVNSFWVLRTGSDQDPELDAWLKQLAAEIGPL